MTFLEMQAMVFADGWYLDNVEGSHYNYKHPTKKGKVTIPRHHKPKDLPKWLVNSIKKQAGLK